MKQLTFDEILFLSLNDNAIPKERGVIIEFAYNHKKMLECRKQFLVRCDRNRFLMKEIMKYDKQKQR